MFSTKSLAWCPFHTHAMQKHRCAMREHCFDKNVVAVNRNHLHFKHMCVPFKHKWEFDSYWKWPYWWKLWKACHRAVDIQQCATFTWCRPFVDIWCFTNDPCHSCVILTAILTWYWQYQARHQAKPRRDFCSYSWYQTEILIIIFYNLTRQSFAPG